VMSDDNLVTNAGGVFLHEAWRRNNSSSKITGFSIEAYNHDERGQSRTYGVWKMMLTVRVSRLGRSTVLTYRGLVRH